MQLIPENWRQSDASTWLLCEICKLGGPVNDLPGSVGSVFDARAHKAFLVRRQVICQLVDVISSDQSPAKGVLYVAGARKTAPNSYVVVGPPTSR
jgi:hypothetical protein